jgi:hypothetical protein
MHLDGQYPLEVVSDEKGITEPILTKWECRLIMNSGMHLYSVHNRKSQTEGNAAANFSSGKTSFVAQAWDTSAAWDNKIKARSDQHHS